MRKILCLCLSTVLILASLTFPVDAAPKKTSPSNFTKPTELLFLPMSAFPSMSRDGKTFVAMDATTFNYPSGSHKCGIKISTLSKTGKWSLTATISENGIKDYIPYIETHPTISGDGSTVVFLGSDPDNGANYLYESTRSENGTWPAATRIMNVPTGWFGPDLSLNEKGDVLAYTQGGGGFFGGTSKLYILRKVNGAWSTPEEILPGETNRSKGMGVLDAAGDTLLFTITSSNNDMYLTDYVDGAWREPVRFTETPEDELNGALSGDGNTVAFYKRAVENSIVKGRQLFWARRDTNGTWSTPNAFSAFEPSMLNMDSPVAFSNDGKSMIRVQYILTKYTDGESYLSGSQILYHVFSGASWDKGRLVFKTDTRTAETPQLSSDGKSILFNRFSTINFIRKIK